MPRPKWIDDVVSVAFPASCKGCGTWLAPADGPICGKCLGEAIRMGDGSYCNRCGQSAGPFALRPTDRPGIAVCGQCGKQPLRYDGLVRVGAFEPPLDELIRRFKFADESHLADVLGDWLAGRLEAAPWLAGCAALTPIPLHWRRRWRRGYNQAMLLADRAGERLGKRVSRVIRRPVHRRPQAGLSRTDRFENVRGVFSVPDPVAVKGKRFCLVDDVCTTGATLSDRKSTRLNSSHYS